MDENEYFHDRRLMISIFMSIVNVHANWYPVDGTIKKVAHHNGNFMKAWLPKASTENERSTVVIETPEGVEVLTLSLIHISSDVSTICRFIIGTGERNHPNAGVR